MRNYDADNEKDSTVKRTVYEPDDGSSTLIDLGTITLEYNAQRSSEDGLVGRVRTLLPGCGALGRIAEINCGRLSAGIVENRLELVP